MPRTAGDAIARRWTAPEPCEEPADNALVTKVVRALYEPWLDRSARRSRSCASPGEAEYAELIVAV